MDDDTAFRPDLYKGEWERKKKRTIGQYNFSPFSDLPVDIASVGEKLIGKVKVDCRFLFNESKWGVLSIGGRTWPAGIIRMDLVFSQTQGYKLMWATIKVTLDGEHKDLGTYRDDSIVETGPVCMTHWGPHEITGHPIAVSETKSRHLTPEISTPQGGLSGVGTDSQKSFESICFCKQRTTIPHEGRNPGRAS
jgi:hypothetical protein